MQAPETGFEGELWVSPDGVVDGWCADPARPGLRCWVEVLAEDRLAATVLARQACEAMAARGFTDLAHGFRAVLPSAALPARPDVLIWARVRGSRRGFAQRLLVRPNRSAEFSTRENALAAHVAALSDDLAVLCRLPPAPAADFWRDAARGLAVRLRA